MLIRFWKFLEMILTLMLSIMILLVFFNVVLRYGFESGLRASEELSRLLFVWVIMLGSVICLKEDTHVHLKELSDHIFPAKIINRVRAILWIVIIFILIAILLGTYEQTLNNWSNLSQLTNLPKGLFYLSGVISMTLMILLSIKNIYLLIKS